MANISSSLTSEQENALVEFLRENWEIFAWCLADMPGVPREFAEHSLQLKPGSRPVKQTMRRVSDPKRGAIEAEVDRLLAAKFIREIKRQTGLLTLYWLKRSTQTLSGCV